MSPIPHNRLAAARNSLPKGCVVVVTLLLAFGGVRADYLKDYWDGREAYRNRKYREAVVFLDRAVKLRPASGGRVRWTGTHFETYLPHFHLGRALYELGLYGEAADVWAESLRQGVILGKQTRREYRELQGKLEAVREERFPETMERLDRDVEQTEEQLRRLRRRGIGGLAVESPRLEEASSLLASARENLSHARTQGGFAPLTDAGKAVTEARMRMLRILEEIDAREAERRREAESGRKAEAQRIYLETAKKLEDGACDREATRQLRALLSDGAKPEALPDEPASLLDLLSRAHEQCGDLLGAQQYLRLALQEREQDADRLRRRYESLAERRRRARAGTGGALDRERVQSDFLIARVTVELHGCDRKALDTMKKLLGPVLETGPPFDPYLDLARAHRACGDRERAAHYAGLARRERGVSADEIGRLNDWLERTREFDLYTESHALVVGVAHYEDEAWGALPEALGDAREVSRLLERHGFTVRMLTDPTTAELNEQLGRFFGRKRPSSSRLVFYYAGHGHTEINEFLRLGYIVPADTPFPGNDPEGDYLRHLVSMDGFEGFATETPANHAMFLFDSCFSGTIFDATRARVRLHPPVVADPQASLRRPVRLFVTAGDETQMVPADSRFRAAVVRAIEGFADGDADGLVLGSELGDFVAEYGTTPFNNPQWGVLDVPGYDAGELAFRVAGDENRGANAAEVFSLAEELALWELVAESENDRDLSRYLDLYPDGPFAPLAAAKLERLNTGTATGLPLREIR